MLFNSFEFLFVFLPICLGGCFLLNRWAGRRPALVWLSVMAIVFYGVWNPRDIVVLTVSILTNYCLAMAMLRAPRGADRFILIGAIVFNLGLLGYFKYWGFFTENIALLVDVRIPENEIVLPLAISFFTFTQIAFLVDVYREKKPRYGLLEYANFVLFFPHLIAGPIIYHKDTIPQFGKEYALSPRWKNLSVGLGLFVLGLSKKVLIADNMALYATPVFDQAQLGVAPDLFAAWQGALAYTFQLYFDFSGYSDMAIGLGFMLGIRLPVNFFSPYKAENIVDFWRRWHVSLSRFVRDYIYIPLGGNRRGGAARTTNILFTMLLMGLWHGAGWTFVLWGFMHGIFIAICHAWRSVLHRFGYGEKRSTGGRVAGRALTFLCVVLGWVIFRAESLGSAALMYEGMIGLHGATIPTAIAGVLNLPTDLLETAGIAVAGTNGLAFATAWLGILALLLFVNLMPNTVELFSGVQPALTSILGKGPVETSAADTDRAFSARLRWTPTTGWSLATAGLTIFCVVQIVGGTGGGEFIYFQF